MPVLNGFALFLVYGELLLFCNRLGVHLLLFILLLLLARHGSFYLGLSIDFWRLLLLSHQGLLLDVVERTLTSLSDSSVSVATNWVKLLHILIVYLLEPIFEVLQDVCRVIVEQVLLSLSLFRICFVRVIRHIINVWQVWNALALVAFVDKWGVKILQVFLRDGELTSSGPRSRRSIVSLVGQNILVATLGTDPVAMICRVWLVWIVSSSRLSLVIRVRIMRGIILLDYILHVTIDWLIALVEVLMTVLVNDVDVS